MPLANAHAVLRQRFNEEWPTAQPSAPIAWPNTPFTPRTKSPFVEFRIIDEGTVQASLGVRPLYRTTGEVRMRINAPGGEGDGRALDLSDSALRIFQEDPPLVSRPWQPDPFKVTSDGVEIPFRIPEGEENAGDLNPDYESSRDTLVQIRLNAAYRETQDPDTSYLIADVLVPYQIDVV